jgi:hypothetical protein
MCQPGKEVEHAGGYDEKYNQVRPPGLGLFFIYIYVPFSIQAFVFCIHLFVGRLEDTLISCILKIKKLSYILEHK